jgi:hypothetical protein
MTTMQGIGLMAMAMAVAGALGCSDSSGGPDGGGGRGGGAAGTGGGGTGGSMTSTGVEGSKRLDSLTTAEKQMVCDWAAAQFGGYGKVMDCGGGLTLTADANQAECVAGAPTNCAMTISEYEVCGRMVSCADPLPVACEPLFQCT